MKIYFAGCSTMPEISQHANSVLESYLYLKNPSKMDKFIKAGLTKDLFLDSGAFTAYTQGTKIDIAEYADFIIENKKHITTYANLDVIGNPQATLENWLYLRNRGLKPLAVVHFGADLKYFDIYIKEHGQDYLALGGLVPYVLNKNKLTNWLNKCFLYIRDLKDDLVKVHLFGITSQWILEKYPAYSCDSTAWLMGGKYGRVIKVNKSKMIIDPYRKFLVKTDGYKSNNTRNVKEYLKLEKSITDLWKARGITWNK